MTTYETTPSKAMHCGTTTEWRSLSEIPLQDKAPAPNNNGIDHPLVLGPWMHEISVQIIDDQTAVVCVEETVTLIPIQHMQYFFLNPFSDEFSDPTDLDKNRRIKQARIGIDPLELDTVGFILREAGEFPLLHGIGENILVLRTVVGDPVAFDRLYRSNMRWAARIAINRYYQFRDSLFIRPTLPDCIQQGFIGLWKAMQRLNIHKMKPGPDSSLPLGKVSTYATWWIEQSVMRYIHGTGKRVGVNISFYWKVRFTAEELEDSGITATPQTVAEKLMLEEPSRKVNLDDVRHILSVHPDFELDAPASDDPHPESRGDFVPAQSDTVEAIVIGRIRKQQFWEVFHQLPIDQQIALAHHIGLEDDVSHSYDQIAGMYGWTRDRVIMLVRNAKREIKQKLENL